MNIIKDKYIRVVGAVSLLILILAGVIFYLTLGLIEQPLIIHFDAYKGVDFLGSQMDVFGILAIGLITLLINFFLSDFLYNRERFLSYIFSFVSLLFSILILIIISVIINVN